MFPHQALSNEFASSYQMPAHLRDTAATMDMCPPITSKNANFAHCEY